MRKNPAKKVLTMLAQECNLNVLFGIDIQSTQETILNKQFER